LNELGTQLNTGAAVSGDVHTAFASLKVAVDSLGESIKKQSIP